MNNLGTIGTVRDNSATYAAGSFEVFVEFTMFGLHFVAHHFVRTDACACDSVYLYTKHTSSWTSDYVKTIDRANLDKVDHRALHLLAVAEATTPADISERFAAIELT